MRSALIAIVIATITICSTTAEAGKVSPVQSSARPLGLKTVAPVMMGATDGRSKAFMEKFLPTMNKAVEQLLPEGKDNRGAAFGNKYGNSDKGKSDDEKKESENGKSGSNSGKSDSKDGKSGSSGGKYESDDGKSGSSGKESGEKDSIGRAIDPSMLKLEYDYNVRAYFVGEGAGYHNGFGFYTSDYDPKQGIQSTDAKLIFPDASSSASYLGSGKGERNEKEPLLPGDFVQLGKLKSGTQINPFLVADGANGGKDVFTPYASKNPDGLQHFSLLSVTAIPNSPYLLLSIEDLRGGGDNDYNDLVVALDIGARNVMGITGAAVPAPPAVWGGLVAFGWVVVARVRARRNQGAATAQV